MSRPNIFRYATRELSLDAMVCWLLECVHSTEEKYHKIGLNFIRFIFDDNTIRDDEVSLELESPHKQFHHMDVYAVVRLKNKLYPIIFENKTNTYLHDNQFEKYCKKVAEWMKSELSKQDEIIYVFLKTGYLFGWQKRDFAKQKDMVCKALTEHSDSKVDLTVREIYLEALVEFLERQDRDDLLEDYYEILRKQKNNREYVFVHGMESVESCYMALDDNKGSNEAACDMLFQRIFGEGSKIDYSHQQWAAKNLFKTTDEFGNETYYCYRFQWCNYKRGKWAYAFQLQQYRDEKIVHGNKEDLLRSKTEEATVIKGICEKVANDIGNKEVCRQFENLKKYPCKSYNGQMILKIFIVDDSSPQVVCDFVREFSEKLCDAVNKSLGSRVILVDD